MATMTAAALVQRLRASLIKPGDDMPGGMFMTEVALGSRRIDGLYCGFFGSRGRFLRGYEVKVARSDWLHELDQPAKAEVWEQNVHEWWIVAPDTNVVRPEELPHGWGLTIPSPNPRTTTRMDVVVKATRHEERNPSWEATHAIIQKADSERMRSTSERVRALQSEHRDGIERELAERLAHDSSTAEHWKQRFERSDALVTEIGEILGLRVIDGATSYGTGAISVGELRESFGRYLVAEKQVDHALRFKLQTIQGVRAALGQAEKALKSIGVRS